MLHNFTLDEDTLFAGQQYRAGWIVARGHWYNLRQVSERGYELLPEEVRSRRPCIVPCMP